MTNEQILNQAIDKAILNGFNSNIFKKNTKWYNGIFFSHDFAKAFWGNKLKTVCCQVDRIRKDGVLICEACGIRRHNFDMEVPWQYHLQTMVLEKEPLKYLEKFI